MQKLIEFYKTLDVDIHKKVGNIKGGISIKAAAYSSLSYAKHIRLYKILNDLVSIQTDGSIENHQKCLNYIQEYVQWVNPQCIIKHIPTNNKDNLVIGFNVDKLENIQEGIMFCGHLDVVAGKLPQFEPTIDNKKIYGRGVADMKGSIACYLDILPYLNTLHIPVILCLTCDEETDMMGIKNVCSFLKKQNIHPQLTILGEPTDNHLGIRSTGIKSYRTIIHGVSAHSSVPSKGVNALFVVAKVLQALEIIMNDIQVNELYLNVGSVSGGGNIALIPDKAEIEWGFRYIREEDAIKAIQLYNDAVVNINSQYPTAQIKTIKTDEFLVYSAFDNKYITTLCQKLQIKTKMLAYTSEAGYLGEIGHNVYLLGCGSIEQAHSDQEYIDIDDLTVYKTILHKLAEITFTDTIRSKIQR